jgi:hypothetical protein
LRQENSELERRLEAEIRKNNELTATIADLEL